MVLIRVKWLVIYETERQGSKHNNIEEGWGGISIDNEEDAWVHFSSIQTRWNEFKSLSRLDMASTKKWFKLEYSKSAFVDTLGRSI